MLVVGLFRHRGHMPGKQHNRACVAEDLVSCRSLHSILEAMAGSGHKNSVEGNLWFEDFFLGGLF